MDTDVLRASYLLSIRLDIDAALLKYRESETFLRAEFWPHDIASTIKILEQQGLVTVRTFTLFFLKGKFRYQTLSGTSWVIESERMTSQDGGCMRFPTYSFITLTDKGTDLVDVCMGDFVCES